MKLLKILLPLGGLLTSAFLPQVSALYRPAASPATVPQEGNKLVYADFETAKDNRPVSNRGGAVRLYVSSENPTNPCHYKGAGTSDAPEIVRPSKDSPNKAIAFDYILSAPNQWASVTLEVSGQADKDGKPVADDVSNYKFLTLQAYVTGSYSLRVEFNSRGQGMLIPGAPPQMLIKISPGFNTYRVPLNSLSQPKWVEDKINPKDLLKKLTSVSIAVYCEQCAPTKGMVVIDNMAFQN